ncbi:unnamed protein product [Pleuronectes platessa]|uniref:Uncharacterized protein n=1 Tax=Pleuronectes platessa TaxID=8262 RepID=A0A9N7TL13_PLEPL|nr:unnamed protein product [Pleuronectes platessa]
MRNMDQLNLLLSCAWDGPGGDWVSSRTRCTVHASRSLGPERPVLLSSGLTDRQTERQKDRQTDRRGLNVLKTLEKSDQRSAPKD